MVLRKKAVAALLETCPYTSQLSCQTSLLCVAVAGEVLRQQTCPRGRGAGQPDWNAYAGRHQAPSTMQAAQPRPQTWARLQVHPRITGPLECNDLHSNDAAQQVVDLHLRALKSDACSDACMLSMQSSLEEAQMHQRFRKPGIASRTSVTLFWPLQCLDGASTDPMNWNADTESERTQQSLLTARKNGTRSGIPRSTHAKHADFLPLHRMRSMLA